jgi:hypothetical protein
MELQVGKVLANEPGHAEILQDNSINIGQSLVTNHFQGGS